MWCCRKLQQLNLGWCECVTEVGLQAVAHCCPDLEMLDLCGCNQVSTAQQCGHLCIHDLLLAAATRCVTLPTQALAGAFPASVLSWGAGARCGLDSTGRDLHGADLARSTLLPPPDRCLDGSGCRQPAQTHQPQCQRLPAHELLSCPGGRPNRTCLAWLGPAGERHCKHQE